MSTKEETEHVPLPTELLRFRSFGRREGDKTAVFDLLTGRVRFALIADFNDPFEGRPRAVPAFRDVGEQRKAMGRYQVNICVSEGLSVAQAREMLSDPD